MEKEEEDKHQCGQEVSSFEGLVEAFTGMIVRTCGAHWECDLIWRHTG